MCLYVPILYTYLLRSVPTVLVGVFARVRCEGRELPGVGALAIFLCRYVCHGVRVPMGGMVLGAVRAWLLGRAVANLLTQYCKHEE